MTLGDILLPLRRGWRWLAGSFLVSALVTVGVTFALPRSYEATATIFLGTGETTTSRERLVRTYAALARNPNIAELVERQPAPRVTRASLRERITVMPVDGTRLLEITASAPNAQQACLLANAYASAFAQRVADLVAAGSVSDRVAVSERAELASSHAEPRRPVLIVFGLLLSLILTATIVAVREARRASPPPSGEDPLHGVPIVGRIPRFTPRPGHAPDDPVEDAFRSLRTSLEDVHDDHGRVLVVTSPSPGDGKSSVVAQLALALSNAGRRVLVVEADLRHPRLERTPLGTGTEREPIGLSDALCGADAIVPSSHPDHRGVDILWAGATVGNTGPLLETSVARVLAGLRADYDHVLVDTSPLSVGADAAIVARAADDVVVVVDRQRTSSASIGQALERLRRVSAPVAGAVLNRDGPLEQRSASGKQRRRNGRRARGLMLRIVRPLRVVHPFWLALIAAAIWPVAASRLGLPVVVLLVVLAVVAVIALRQAERVLAAVLVMTPLAGASVDALGLSILRSHPVKPMLYVVPAAVALCSLALARTRRRRLPRSIGAAFVAFLAVSLAASVQGLHADAAPTPLIYLLGSAALFAAVCLIGDTRRRLRVIAAGALGGLVVAGAQGAFGSLLGVDPLYGFATQDSVVGRVHGSFAHPNQYGLFLALLLPLAVAIVASRRLARELRWLAAAGLVLGLPALVLSYSRGALAGLVIGPLIWMLAMRPRAVLGPVAWVLGLRPVVIRQIAVVGIAALVTLVPSSVRERFEGSSTRSDLTQRNALWDSALQTYAERPILGVGVGAFPDAYALVESAAGGAATRPLLSHGNGETLPYHAHNAFFTVAAEQGMLGLLALLALGAAAFSIASRASRLSDPLGRAIGMGAGAALVVWAVDNMFNVSLYEETTLPLAALLALAWGFIALDEDAKHAPAPAMPAAAGGGVLLRAHTRRQASAPLGYAAPAAGAGSASSRGSLRETTFETPSSPIETP